MKGRHILNLIIIIYIQKLLFRVKSMRVVVFLVTYVRKSSSLHIIILCIFTLIMYVLIHLWMDGMEMVSIWISKVLLAVMGKTQDRNKGLLEFRRWHSLPFVEQHTKEGIKCPISPEMDCELLLSFSSEGIY